MILDNLSRAFRTQNWFAVATEFVIVILGVVIGFQITAWAEGRLVRLEESFVLDRLEADMIRLLASADWRVERVDALIGDLDVIIAAIDAGALAPEDADDFEQGLRLARYTAVLPGRAGAYAELQSGGKVQLISDNVLRGQVSRLHDMVDASLTHFSSLNVMMATVSPAFDGYFHLAATGPAPAMADYYDEPNSFRPLAAYDLDAMLTDPAFRTHVEILREVQAQFLEWHTAYQNLAREICARMGQRYDRSCEPSRSGPHPEVHR